MHGGEGVAIDGSPFKTSVFHDTFSKGYFIAQGAK